MNAQYTETVFESNTIMAIPRDFPRRYTLPMGYLDQLAKLRKSRGLTQSGLAEKMGVEQPTIQRWEKGKREPNFEQLFQLASILGVDAGSLIDPAIATAIGPRLFVKGEVAAGVWRAALEAPQEEWQSFTGRADVMANLEHRFGLRVVGDSMDLIYPPGTIVECVSTFGHIEPEVGRRVVIVRENHSGEVEATVKELVETDGELWAVPRSNNPSHTPFNLTATDPDIAEVRIAAVVVASVRPE